MPRFMDLKTENKVFEDYDSWYDAIITLEDPIIADDPKNNKVAYCDAKLTKMYKLDLDVYTNHLWNHECYKKEDGLFRPDYLNLPDCGGTN